MMKRICILGTGPSSRGDAPYDDPSVEMWTIARGMFIPPRVDLLFEMHAPALWDGWGNKDGTALYVDMLREWDKTDIMMQDRFPEIPRSKRLPREEISAVVTPRHLGAEHDYETSQVSWMISYAIQQIFHPAKAAAYWQESLLKHDYEPLKHDHEPLGEIMFYGIDLVSEGEARSYQRHCLEYYVGMARAMGIRLTVADKSSLCKMKQHDQYVCYGYDYPLTRDEAIYIYGHPARQLVTNKDGTVKEIRELPGVYSMPMIGPNGKDGTKFASMKMLSALPETIKAAYSYTPKDLERPNV